MCRFIVKEQNTIVFCNFSWHFLLSAFLKCLRISMQSSLSVVCPSGMNSLYNYTLVIRIHSQHNFSLAFIQAKLFLPSKYFCFPFRELTFCLRVQVCKENTIFYHQLKLFKKTRICINRINELTSPCHLNLFFVG